MISAVLMDLSGVLYVGGTPLPGAHQALHRLERAGVPVKFVTNTTRSTRQMILTQLENMLFRINPNALFTATQAVLHYLEQHDLEPSLLIHPHLEAEFPSAPAGKENAVLVGDAGDAFNYRNMNRVFRILLDGAPLLAMGYNRYFREPDGFSLDLGPFVAALEFASGARATILGKPSAAYFHSAVFEFNCDPGEVMMVGDDAEADVGGALAAGLQGTLVRTGKYRPGDEIKIQKPGAHVVEDITAAVDWILQSSS